MKRKTALTFLLPMGLLILSGCGKSPDVPAMKEGLIHSGMPEAQAACFAEKMSKTVDGEPYNYMASLMKEGLDEKDATNRARRKYGAEFRKPMLEARKDCVE